MADDIPPELSDAALLARANRAAMAANGTSGQGGQGEIVAAAPYGSTDLLANRFTFGLSDMASAAGLAANRYLTGTTPGFDYSQAATEIGRGREAFQNQDPFKSALLSVVGSVGNPAGQVGRLIPAMGRAGQIATGVATGGTLGAVQGAAENSATPEQAWQGALEGGKTGAIVGGAIPTAIAAARALVPGNPQAQLLRSYGVEPPPGATAGGLPAFLEEWYGRIPGFGAPVQAARRSAQQQFTEAVDTQAQAATQAVENQSQAFNRNTINGVLGHVGESLDANTPVGNQAIDEMADKVGAAYKAAVPNAGAQVDKDLLDAIAALRAKASMMGPGRAEQLDNYIKTYVTDKIGPSGQMAGDAFKNSESDLGKEAKSFFSLGSTSDERQVGGALRDLQTNLRDWLARTNPGSAAELQAANRAWSEMLRVQDAAASHPEGLLTGSNLLNASRKFGGRAQFSRGQALLEGDAQQALRDQQALVDAGRTERDTLLDAGRSLRAPREPIGTGAGIGTGIAAAATIPYLLAHPAALAATLATYPAVAGAYSNPGRAFINSLQWPQSGLLAAPQRYAPLAAQYAASSGPGLLSGLLRP
jgi:hypothetical protein